MPFQTYPVTHILPNTYHVDFCSTVPPTTLLVQCTMNVKKYIFAHRVAAWHQGLKMSSWSNMPQQGDDTKKITPGLAYPENANTTAGTVEKSQKLVKKVTMDKTRQCVMELFASIP